MHVALPAFLPAELQKLQSGCRNCRDCRHLKIKSPSAACLPLAALSQPHRILYKHLSVCTHINHKYSRTNADANATTNERSAYDTADLHSMQARTIAKAPGCERELTRQGASLHPVHRITCPPPCELHSLATCNRCRAHTRHTCVRTHSPSFTHLQSPTKTCSDVVGQHA